MRLPHCFTEGTSERQRKGLFIHIGVLAVVLGKELVCRVEAHLLEVLAHLLEVLGLVPRWAPLW